MFQIDIKSGKSIYEQIIDGLKEQIVSGEMPADSKLPSVRELSSLLTVNPNTVQKAYRQLEQQGWIYSASGLGSFVNADALKLRDEERIAAISSEISALVRQLFYFGADRKEICDLLQGMVDERRGSND